MVLVIVCVIYLVIYKCYVLKVVQVGTTVNFAILRLRYLLLHKMLPVLQVGITASM